MATQTQQADRPKKREGVAMARKKVKLEWIANDAARRATFKKRRKGLMKKVSELSTLCDIKACLIVYGHNETAPEVWPSVPDAARVLAKLRRMPEMEQSKKMMNQEGFMRQRIGKLQEQLRKQDRENRELETTVMMYHSLMGRGLEGAGIEEVTSLAWLVEMKVNEVKKRVEARKLDSAKKAGKGVVKEEAVEAVKAVDVPSAAGGRLKEKSPLEVAMEELQRQEWFTDIMNPPAAANAGSSMATIAGVGDLGYAAFVEHNGSGGSSHNNPWMDAYFPLN